MLAPGDYLIKPAEPEPAPELPTTRDAEPTQLPAADIEEAERQTFLLILLRALGAIHT